MMRGYRSIVCCCDHSANLSGNHNGFDFDNKHSNKNLNGFICFRVVGGTDYNMGGITCL